MLYNSADMDEDCRNILEEIAARDWLQELEKFRQDVIEREAEKSSRDRLSRIREASLAGGSWYGALMGVLMGPGLSANGVTLILGLFMMSLITASVAIGGIGWLFSLFLLVALPISIAMASFLLSLGYSFVGPLITATVGFLSGAILHAWIREMSLREEEKLIRQLFREEMRTYILSPANLLEFWDTRLRNYLMARQSEVQKRIKECRRIIEECQHISRELLNSPEANALTTIEKLDRKRQEQEAILNDAFRANHLLNQLEKSFLARIDAVEKLEKQKRALEKKQEYRRHLRYRVEILMGRADENLSGWLLERQNLETEAVGAVRAFEDQLLHSRDYIEAQMELLEDKKDQNFLRSVDTNS